ncbi:MAG: hypothetical protein ABI378_07185 [Chitinophagaceae bacterium]
MNTRIICAIAIALSLSACQKSSDSAPDASKVAFTISSPMPGQSFRSGDTVSIQATVNYDNELHGYEVKIEDTASGFILYDDAQHVHNDHFVISDTWVANATQTTALKLSIIATVDHDGTTARKDLYFEMKP